MGIQNKNEVKNLKSWKSRVTEMRPAWALHLIVNGGASSIHR